MKRLGRMFLTTATLFVATSAQATDWWCVPSDRQDRAIQFVDADTVVRSNNNVSFRVLRIDRTGESRQEFQQFRCDMQLLSSDDRDIRDFACADMETRMNSAVMLGTMTPQQASHVIFVSIHASQDNVSQ